MRKRTIAAAALVALAAGAIGVGVVAGPAAAALEAQACHGRLVSTFVQYPEFGPGGRAAATRALGDYPKAVQDAQRAVRAFCASPPLAGSSSIFGVFNSSNGLFVFSEIIDAPPGGFPPQSWCQTTYSLTPLDGALPNYNGNATLTHTSEYEDVLTLLDMAPPNTYVVHAALHSTVCGPLPE